MDFSDAPSGDLNLDDVFGPDSNTVTTQSPDTKEPPAAVDSTKQSTEPFIKTRTGTLYKTPEDAVEGIEHKDALIAQLREQVRNNTGHDPLVAKPDTKQPVNYVVDQDKYFEDIARAVETKNTKAYMEAQQKLIWDSLGPIAPTITALSRANAERVVAEQLPEFKGFLNSEQYQTIGQSSPLLLDAIKAAESNPAAASQLPELYRIAYLASQGSRVPELIQSAQHSVQQVTPRPTVQSTQLAPPPTNSSQVQPGLNSTAERKAMIERQEASGVLNLKW